MLTRQEESAEDQGDVNHAAPNPACFEGAPADRAPERRLEAQAHLGRKIGQQAHVQQYLRRDGDDAQRVRGLAEMCRRHAEKPEHYRNNNPRQKRPDKCDHRKQCDIEPVPGTRRSSGSGRSIGAENRLAAGAPSSATGSMDCGTGSKGSGGSGGSGLLSSVVIVVACGFHSRRPLLHRVHGRESGRYRIS